MNFSTPHPFFLFTVFIFLFKVDLSLAQEINDLVFIHHSCGSNWLDNSLHTALLAKDYIDERNDITYGTTMSPNAGRPASLGGTPGDNTNMNHWILWFNDYLQGVRVHGCANGYNRIIMFKSCYPISDVTSDGTEPGNPFSSTQSLTNYKAVYRHPNGAGNTYSYNGYTYKPLEDIFAEHPDILFIPVTAPPLHYGPSDATNNANAHRARLFNNWLKNEWLAKYKEAHPGLDNVAVFDWFDFLAYPDDHPLHPNRLREEYGGNSGDSHPNSTANAASTVVFASGSNNFLDQAWAAFSTNSVEVQLKIFLQGFFYSDADTMSSRLRWSNSLPTTSPYSENRRTLTSLPQNISDWVLVQLRSTPTGAAMASKSVLLRKDGRLVGDLGQTPRFAIDASDGNYYLVVKHRNHAAIMSSVAVALSKGSSTLYDFTVAQNQFYSSSETVELESGIWGLWAGDINRDGHCTTQDYVLWYNSMVAEESGYSDGDLDGNTMVDNEDYELWLSNGRAGRATDVH